MAFIDSFEGWRGLLLSLLFFQMCLRSSWVLIWGHWARSTTWIILFYIKEVSRFNGSLASQSLFVGWNRINFDFFCFFLKNIENDLCTLRALNNVSTTLDYSLYLFLLPYFLELPQGHHCISYDLTQKRRKKMKNWQIESSKKL